MCRRRERTEHARPNQILQPLLLQVTDQKEVRYCDSCKKSVYQVIDMEGYEQTVAKSRCVMVEGYDIKTKKQHVLLGNVEVARYNTGQGLDWS